jgi:hypothetical protein
MRARKLDEAVYQFFLRYPDERQVSVHEETRLNGRDVWVSAVTVSNQLGPSQTLYMFTDEQHEIFMALMGEK